MLFGIPTIEDRDALSSQLALLYLEKADIPGVSPTDFAKKYFEVKKEIYDEVMSKDSL